MTSPAVLLVEAFNEAFNRHDADAMLALMTDDCIFENTVPPPDGARYVGQAEGRAFWRAFFRASPAARIEIEELVICGEWGFQRWVYRWMDPAGQAGHVRGVDVFRFRNGKIAEKLSYVKG